MMYPYDTTWETVHPSLQEIGRWPLLLGQLHTRLAPYFARREPHEHALSYLQAIVSEIPRKNSWQIAEQARHARPYGMQRLLSQAVWDHEGVRNELRSLVVETLSPCAQETVTPEAPFPVLALDESGFPKRGSKSAGVAQQYCGARGEVANCQMGVFLSYVTARGHSLIDRELYLPDVWTSDAARREGAHIPTSVDFATKPQLGCRMLQRALDAGVPVCWVVADTVYGHSSQLRFWLEDHGLSFALAVPSLEAVCVRTPQGARICLAGAVPSLLLGPHDWHPLSMYLGTKGERLYDWAILPMLHRGEVDGRHWLVIRRSLEHPEEQSFYLVLAPPATSLSTIVRAIGARWCIEVDLELSKDLGLDQYEVRSYPGWYRHLTLVLLAQALLLTLCLLPSSSWVPRAEVSATLVPLIALSPSEVRHLLARLIWPGPSSGPFILAWSCFRRTHQYWARFFHHKRRLIG